MKILNWNCLTTYFIGNYCMVGDDKYILCHFTRDNKKVHDSTNELPPTSPKWDKVEVRECIIEKAKQFAIKAHGNQKYGKMPYAYHLQQVVSKLIMWRDRSPYPVSDVIIASGWLHDVVEDCDTSYKILEQEFGQDITSIVYNLTKNKYVPYEEYIHTIKNHRDACIVKMADTLCNLEASMVSGQIKRVNKYAKQLALLTE